MSLSIPKLTRRRVFAAAIETTTGTAVALTGTNGVFNAYNHSLKEVSQTNEREGQSSLSPLPPVAGAQSGEYDFTTEFFGTGTTGSPSWATTLLAGCGFAHLTGDVWKPATGQGTTLTMGMYTDGRLREIKGAAGDCTIKCENGKPIQFAWKYKGAWTDPSDVALIAPTYPVIIPPIFTGATVTIGGTAYRIPSLEIQLGNTVTLRPDVNSTCGYFAAMITACKPKIMIPAEALALATKNWSTDRKANTSYALSAAIGANAGNILTITAPAMYQSDPPNDKDEQGILQDELTFVPARSSAGGDDHLAFAFT